MSTPPSFDPTAPLPGPPDPWDAAPTPSLRPGPPYHMTDMIAAEPAMAARILRRLADPDTSAAALADTIRATIAAGDPVIVTGCGTSEHGALAVAAIVRDAARTARLGAAVVAAEQAFELDLVPASHGLVIGVSHEGGTAATNAALEAARDAGRMTAVITVSGRSPAGALADIVVETEELDQGWCHTVGYLSPILAGAAIGAHLSGRPLDPAAVTDLLAAGARDEAAAERIAAALADAPQLLVIASGSDRPAGRELVLKVEEASWLPSAYRDLETFLHGHLPATGPSTGLVLILTDRDRRAVRIARAAPGPRRRPRDRASRGGHRVGRSRCGTRSGTHPRRPARRARGRRPPGAGSRAGRVGDAAPAPDRTPGAGTWHQPGPDPPGRPGLPRGGAGRRRLTALTALTASPPVRPARREPRPSRRSCRGPRAGGPGA